MNIMAGIKVATEVIKILGMAVEIADKFVEVMNKAGYLKNTNNTEDLGGRALVAEQRGIRPEDYDKYDDYIKEIDSFEIGKEEKTLFSSKERILAGSKIIDNYMNEHYGEQSKDFIMDVVENKEFYNKEGRLDKYLEKTEYYDLPIEYIGKYYNGTIN